MTYCLEYGEQGNGSRQHLRCHRSRLLRRFLVLLRDRAHARRIRHRRLIHKPCAFQLRALVFPHGSPLPFSPPLPFPLHCPTHFLPSPIPSTIYQTTANTVMLGLIHLHLPLLALHFQIDRHLLPVLPLRLLPPYARHTRRHPKYTYTKNGRHVRVSGGVFCMLCCVGGDCG
jgi:hypothetical protein